MNTSRHLTWEGAKASVQRNTLAELDERIRFELFTIKTMGFAGYFLNRERFYQSGQGHWRIHWPGPWVCRRQSVVAYCIGITNIDPIKYNLLFERFSESRSKINAGY